MFLVPREFREQSFSVSEKAVVAGGSPYEFNATYPGRKSVFC